MALQSEVSPPLVGDANKDTKIDGDTKSTDDNESSQSTDEDVDLEEGEILDSGAEEEEEKKDFTNSSLKEALDKSCLQSIEQLISQSKNLETSLPKPSKPISPRKLQNKLAAKYLDHDQILDNSDQEDGWYPSPSKYKPKFEEKPIDYRMELAAYRGTPPSSPDHKKKDEKRKKRSSKKSKKTSRKTIKRKDIKGMRVMKYKKESVKGRICKFFKEGKCAKGADCLFSHASPTSYKKKELCKFYLNGHCNKGKECLYMHSEFPCKFYHTGSECYAKEDCRFSHAPLTDEMKRILADYLKLHHGDDDHEGRKRRVSSSPEPKGSAPKRPCLLGSPPRHIREAEETKRWQEEMKLLQQQNHPGFEIRISPNRESSSPPQCPKPNFYQETLPSTPPQKRRTAPEASTPLAHPSGFSQSSAFPKSNNSGMFIEGSPKIYQYDEEYAEEMDVSSAKQDTSNDFSWKNVHNLVHIPDQQELDFTSDVKFDETTQFSEMESSTDCPPVLSPGPTVPSTVENKDNESNDASNQETSKTGDDGISAVATSNSSSDPPAPPIVIPSHLPRKQRELFMRIQQHQKKNAVITENIDISNSPSNADIVEPQIKKEDCEVEDEKPETDKTDSKWYSSEDDDDDADQPLTDVLKKLRQTPPPVAKEPESKPTVNLMEMLNKIQKNTLERNKAAVDTKPPQDNFWQNILLGSVPSSQPLIPALSTVSSEPKRRTLLPDPQPLPVPAVKKEPVVPKDPRLKNRDPRTLANSNTSNNAANIPKTTASETNNLLLNTPPVQDIKSLLSKTTSVTSEPPKENIPYRLHGIYTTPPNYTPYIHASQSNPKLLDDPRLRKHLNLTQSNESSFKITKELDPIKSEPKDVPPIPKSLLKYEKPDSLNINIFETSSLKSSNEDAQDCKPQPPIMRKLIDPRIRRRDSHSNSGSDTPPHLTIVETSTTPPPLQEFKTAPILENALLDPVFEKKWLPPVLEKNWTPPVLEKNLYNVVIKKEIDSDSEDSPDPPRLEISESPIETISMSSKKEETVKSEESVSDKDKSVPPLVPPLIIKRGKPTPASHLPKAIADPRMAKLHHPLDPRRPRAAFADSNSKVIVERKKANQTENERPPDKNSINELKSSGDLSLAKNESKETVTAVETDDKQKTVKNIPKKCKLSEKSEEKKKTVHRNRKSSMDYASPLNSCDDTNSNKSLNYNSYNQRPNQRTVKPITDTESLTSSTSLSAPEVSENTIISDYLLSDNSNIEGDNIDVNLKDMFKTIDPTASPFC